jgi:ABC-type multidrug transport system ATPase subunit
MIILSHGQIVAEGTLLELQKEFINNTVFEIVAHGNRIDLQRVIRKIDESCELVQDDPVEVTGKRRFTFSTEKGSEVAESILRRLLEVEQFKVSEFQITRPDLETIFLRATKKNWEDQDLLGRKKKRPLVTNEQNS